MRAEANPEQRDELLGAVRRELDRLAVPAEVRVNLDLRWPRRGCVTATGNVLYGS
jgi:hypothetical protein